MRSLFTLFVFTLIVLTIKQHSNVKKKYNLVRLDVTRYKLVDRKFTLHIPLSIKFGDKLVNPKRQGIIYINVKDSRFCYVRSVGINRNEYWLTAKCGNYLRIVNVTHGDEIEINFALANMMEAGNVPLFGEEEVDEQV